jgi:hypothetical protein
LSTWPSAMIAKSIISRTLSDSETNIVELSSLAPPSKVTHVRTWIRREGTCDCRRTSVSGGSRISRLDLLLQEILASNTFWNCYNSKHHGFRKDLLFVSTSLSPQVSFRRNGDEYCEILRYHLREVFSMAVLGFCRTKVIEELRIPDNKGGTCNLAADEG